MKLTGVMPALVTPFDAQGNIDFKAFETHMTKLRAASSGSDEALACPSLS